MTAFQPSLIIIDTALIDSDEPIIKLKRERTVSVLNAAPVFPGQDAALVGVVSRKGMEMMAANLGYQIRYENWVEKTYRNREGFPPDYFTTSKWGTRRYTFYLEMHRRDSEDTIFHVGHDTAKVLEYVPNNLTEVRMAPAAAGYQEKVGNMINGENDANLPRAGARDASRPRRNDGDNAETIHRRGYKTFVGGANVWESIAKLQFDFMISKGLKPDDKFVDVGCGALRGGQHFIQYLNQNNYYGLDKHIELIIYGVVRALGISRFKQKMPHFVVSGSFEFERLGAEFSYGLAQSLFTHLTAEDVSLCLSKLYEAAANGCQFYATFFEFDSAVTNAELSHSGRGLKFTRAEMEKFGINSGWQPHYIGYWGHPRGQRMMLYVKTANQA